MFLLSVKIPDGRLVSSLLLSEWMKHIWWFGNDEKDEKGKVFKISEIRKDCGRNINQWIVIKLTWWTCKMILHFTLWKEKMFEKSHAIEYVRGKGLNIDGFERTKWMCEGKDGMNMKINRSKRFPRPSKNPFDREVKLMELNDNVKNKRQSEIWQQMIWVEWDNWVSSQMVCWVYCCWKLKTTITTTTITENMNENRVSKLLRPPKTSMSQSWMVFESITL